MNTSYVVKSGGKRGTHYYEHRAVWSAANGPIPAGYHIHHINENRKDNRLENLALIAASEHHRHHFKEIANRPEHIARTAKQMRDWQASRPTQERICNVCSTLFAAREHNQHGYSNYCSPNCRSKARYRRKVGLLEKNDESI